MPNLLSSLIPNPQKVQLQEGFFSWDGGIVLVLEANNDADRVAADTLIRACRECGIPEPSIRDAGSCDLPTDGSFVIAGDPCSHPVLGKRLRTGEIPPIPAEIGDDGYVLDITPEGVYLYGNTSAGVYYGFQTLIQVLRTTDDLTHIPTVSITDWTDLRERGVLIDFGRGEVYTLQALKRDVEIMAHYKLNMLLIYLEDAFLFPSHPDIGERRDRMTMAEAKELDAFAKLHHITLVPFLDSPGHMERILACPAYQHLAVGDENFGMRSAIDVTNPESYELLSDLYGDLAEAFSGPYIHIGGDEAFALGAGKAKPLADLVGTANLYVRHLKRLREILKSHGKRIMVGADPFEPGFFRDFGMSNYGLEALHQVPRDIILHPWHYGPVKEFPFGEQAKSLGFEQHMMSSMESHHGFFPLFSNSFANVESYIPYAHRLKTLGAIHTNWGDKVTFRELSWPQLAHFGEWVWREDGRPGELMLPSVMESLFGPDTGALANTILFLAHVDDYFPWARLGMMCPAARIIFDLKEPRELDAAEDRLLSDFREALEDARAYFEQSRAKARQNMEYYDFIEFALKQAECLGDIVAYRHLLARYGKQNGAKTAGALTRLSRSLEDLLARYEVLWHRARRPLGFLENAPRFERLIKSLHEDLRG